MKDLTHLKKIIIILVLALLIMGLLLLGGFWVKHTYGC
ncbi:hypothetical protein ADIS_2870 [Lunatimonas lonarensis]|uniref:Uncharacterized protein n=1 Tax=Lunatimonas lonarensis TaxID=1232681 RepID=R7ZQM7_9BACT|nr:hypothetical protein ADIS_2870 [Lunatimonas lonarensis]